MILNSCRTANLLKNLFVKFHKLSIQNRPPSICLGAPQPPTPKVRWGIFQTFLALVSFYPAVPNYDEFPPHFREILGKSFAFRPPSGGTANCNRGKLRRAGEKMVFSQFSKNSQNRLIGGRDIPGQTKFEFPGQEYGNPIRAPTPVTGARKHY